VVASFQAEDARLLAGVEPRAYLGQAARRAIRNPGAVMLPHDFKQLDSDEASARQPNSLRSRGSAKG
jgi:hypothetical protein